MSASLSPSSAVPGAVAVPGGVAVPAAVAVPGAVAAPREPIRVRMGVVLLAVLAVLVAELVAGVLVGVPPHLLGVGMCLSTVVVFGLVFCFGAITIAGFAAGAGAAGVVVLEPGWLAPALLALAVMAVVCGLAPGWARVEAWQAVRSAPVGEAGQRALSSSAPTSLPSRLAVRWRTDRVVAAFLVLAFPPVFVTAAIAFITWTAHR
ncbi:hypothetical protein SAMN03159343_0044 [Klenkia marina]|uniref:Uncharacterized protein n=1 Tax=Klenkia marina TaxID=1960309 RepID=A0A1G4Z712_9ACTN|nr:hypothetical protein [Klenkia marina]SCX61068.1 hypothetical protein SAMN03159343_0044 [Klenkia marina]